MTRATTLVAMGAAIILGGPASALAQNTDEMTAFVSIYAGAQPMRRSITATDSFPLYDETATVTSTQRIRNSALFKGAFGYPVASNLAVGGGLSYSGRPGTATIEAQLPDPIFYDRVRTVPFDANDLKHTELGINVSLFYRKALTPKFDLVFSGGPSFIRVEQEIALVNVPTGATAPAVTKRLENGNAFGVNAGVDGIYDVSQSLGVGVFVHYMGGKLDLPSVAGMTVGGPQAGVVLRVGF